MSEGTDSRAVDTVHGALSAASSTAYVRTPSPAALAVIVDAVARLDDPPTVRVLARHRPITGWLRRSTPRMREPLDGGTVELRASPTVVTETTVVTEETVARFGEDGEEKPAAESRAFVESVYESHARAWRRADPVASGRRRAVSG